MSSHDPAEAVNNNDTTGVITHHGKHHDDG